MNWLDAERIIYENALANVEATNKALVRVYLTVQSEITDELKQFFLSIDPSWSAQYQAQRLSEIFSTINTRLSAFTGFTTDRIENAFLGQYQDTFNSYAYNLCDYYSKPGVFPILPFSQVDESVIRAALNEKIGEYSFLNSMADKQADLQQALREAVAVSITKGEGIVALVDRLKETFDSGISRYVATSRTEMLRSFSLAQDETYKQAMAFGISFKFQWLSASDGRTRPAHAAMNGKFAKEYKEDGTPIFHVGASVGSGPRLLRGIDSASQNINCRCRKLAVPLEISEEDQDNFPMLNNRPDYNEYLKMIS